MKKVISIIGIICLLVVPVISYLFLTSNIFAQDKANNTEEVLEEAEEIIKPVVDEQPEQTIPSLTDVIVIINSDNIDEVLIVGDNGSWLSDAREIQINLNIARGSPTIKCTMYKGLFRPTNPEIKTWTVQHIMSANTEEFQGVIDGLNKGESPTIK